jgi:hypothetical protein
MNQFQKMLKSANVNCTSEMQTGWLMVIHRNKSSGQVQILKLKVLLISSQIPRDVG